MRRSSRSTDRSFVPEVPARLDADALASRVRWQFVLASAFAALQCSLPVLFVVLWIRAVDAGPVRGDALIESIGWRVPLVLWGGCFALVVLTVLLLGRRGRINPVRWWRRSREPDRHLPKVERALEAMAIASAISVPRLIVRSDEVANAAATGAPGRAVVVVTTGVEELPEDEIEALLAHQLATITDRTLRTAQAGRALIGWSVAAGSLVWAGMFTGFVIGAAAQRTRPGAIGIAVGGVVELVAIPFGIAIVLLTMRLAGHTDLAADRAAMALTHRPWSYAALLLTLTEDHRRTRPGVNPLLWFERDGDGDRLMAIASRIGAQPGLVARAAAACAEDAGGAPDLVERLSDLEELDWDRRVLVQGPPERWKVFVLGWSGVVLAVVAGFAPASGAPDGVAAWTVVGLAMIATALWWDWRMRLAHAPVEEAARASFERFSQRCIVCDGRGVIDTTRQGFFGPIVRRLRCPRCDGTGIPPRPHR